MDSHPAPEALPTTPAPDPLTELSRQITIVAALDRALAEDGARMGLTAEEATPAALAHRAEAFLAAMPEHERQRRFDRARRILARVEQIVTAA